MDMAVTVGLFLVGLVCIIKGGDYFVDAAVWMAEVTGMPRFLIGATVVSLATTLPELMVSSLGVLQGEVELAMGNAVGSVTANLGLILGVSLLFLPSAVAKRQFWPKAVLMLAAAGTLWTLCRGGTMSTDKGLVLLVLFALFVAVNLRDAWAGAGREATRQTTTRRRTLLMLGKFSFGVAGILVGSQLLVDKGSDIALLLGVPAGIVGVTLVAVGTSLPELVTMVTALMKRETALSVGNIIGANVIDLTLILPVCALLSGGRLEIAPQTLFLDLPACALVCLVAALPPLWTGRFYRWQGLALLALYGVYLTALVV